METKTFLRILSLPNNVSEVHTTYLFDRLPHQQRASSYQMRNMALVLIRYKCQNQMKLASQPVKAKIYFLPFMQSQTHLAFTLDSPN